MGTRGARNWCSGSGKRARNCEILTCKACGRTVGVMSNGRVKWHAPGYAPGSWRAAKKAKEAANAIGNG